MWNQLLVFQPSLKIDSLRDYLGKAVKVCKMCNLERKPHVTTVSTIRLEPVFQSPWDLDGKLTSKLVSLLEPCGVCFKNDQSDQWGLSYFALLWSEEIMRNLCEYLIYCFSKTVPLNLGKIENVWMKRKRWWWNGFLRISGHLDCCLLF